MATAATEAAWVAAAAGKNLRQIESLVSGHRPGDEPEDPPDPDVRTQVVRFELSAGTFALLRQATGALDDEHGRHLSDDELIAALCNRVLDGAPAVEPSGRAKFQIAVTVCERCRRGWQDGAGAPVAIEASAVERAMCDAQHIGSIDGGEPERAYQDVPPSVVRFVWRRDGGRCRVPGCRSARGLEIHHLVHRADGGNHDALNLALLCSACHLAHHRGALTITGTADDLVVHRPGEANGAAQVGTHVGVPDASRPTGDAGTHVGSSGAPDLTRKRQAVETAGSQAESVASVASEVTAPSRYDIAVLRTQSKQALVGMGWKAAVAEAAVDAAVTAVGPVVPLERLIFEALRRCPRPKA